MSEQTRRPIRGVPGDGLKRLLGQLAQVRSALEEAARETQAEPLHIGEQLLGQFPDLEALAALHALARESTPAGHGDQALPEAERPVEELLQIVSGSRVLTDALFWSFPHQYHQRDMPLLAVLVSDPLLDELDAPIQERGSRLPWAWLEARLAQGLRSSGRSLRVEWHAATRERASEVLPRARYAIVLGSFAGGGAVFEEAHTCRRCLLSSEELARLFPAGSMDAVLLLGQGSRATAMALQAAGLPVAVSIEAGPTSVLEDMVDVAASFLCGLVQGQTPAEAGAQAARPGVGVDVAEAEGREPYRRALLPGQIEAVPPFAWADVRPRETFVGRRALLAATLRHLQRPGLLALVGQPGIGKSEAVRALLSHCRLHRWPGAGSLYIEASSLKTGMDLIRATVAALPIGRQPTAPNRALGTPTTEADFDPRDRGRTLGSEERLVILDDVDGLLGSAEARETLKRLLEGSTESGLAQIVVTSRQRLPWLLGREQEVQSLSVAEATLVLERVVCGEAEHRAGSPVRGRWEVLKRDAEMAALVKELDGHPLALMLAGAELGAGEPPQRVLRALHQRGDLRPLGATGEEAGREESVAACLDLSRQRLQEAAPTAEELWRILAELPGGVPDGAELPAEDEQDLRLLRRFSLVEHRDGAYRCLGPVRAYLRRQVSGGVAEARGARLRTAVAQALAGMLAEWTRLLEGRGARAALAGFARWLPTLEVILDGTAEQHPLGAGHEAQAAEMLADAVSLATRTGMPQLSLDWCERARPWQLNEHSCVAMARARLLLSRHRVRDARGEAERAWRLAERGGDRHGAAMARLAIARIYLYEGQLNAARHEFRAMQLQFEREQDRLAQAEALYGLGEVDINAGRLHDADQPLTEALRLFRAAGRPGGIVKALCSLATLAHIEERLDEAEERRLEALDLVRAQGDRLFEATILLELGELDQQRGLVDRARARFAEAKVLFESLQQPLAVATIDRLLAELDWRAGHAAGPALRDRLENVLRVLRAHGEGGTFKIELANALLVLGQIEVTDKLSAQADQHLSEALRLLRDAPNRADPRVRTSEAATLFSLGWLAAHHGSTERARRYFDEALSIYQSVGHSSEAQGGVQTELARLDLADGRATEALTRLLHARQLFGARGSHQQQAIVLRDTEKVLLELGQGENAATVASAAALLVRRLGLEEHLPLSPALLAQAAESESRGEADQLLAAADALLNELASEQLSDKAADPADPSQNI